MKNFLKLILKKKLTTTYIMVLFVLMSFANPANAQNTCETARLDAASDKCSYNTVVVAVVGSL